MLGGSWLVVYPYSIILSASLPDSPLYIHSHSSRTSARQTRQTLSSMASTDTPSIPLLRNLNRTLVGARKSCVCAITRYRPPPLFASLCVMQASKPTHPFHYPSQQGGNGTNSAGPTDDATASGPIASRSAELSSL